MVNRKVIEDRAREIATNTFSDGTMRTMLYERIVAAFAERRERPPTDAATAPRGDNTAAVGAIYGLR